MHPDIAKKLREIEWLKKQGCSSTHPDVCKKYREIEWLKSQGCKA